MRSALLADAAFLLLTPLLLLLVILAFGVYRYLVQPAVAHFLLPAPRHSVRGWCTLRKL